MKNFQHVIIVILVLISNLLQAQKYTFSEIPNWVKSVTIPQESLFSKYDIVSGYYLTLADYQVNLEQEAVFTHEVTNVVSYSGITNASQLSIRYDTTYQKLIVHHLFIWRKGKKIDRTHDLSLEILNNESQLNQGIYTGLITAYNILNDIRKDDLIDFAYTLEGDNPIFDKEKYLFQPIEMMNPIDLYTVHIFYPIDKDYIYTCVDCDSIRFDSSSDNNYKHIEISRSNVKPADYEESMPSWLIPYSYFTLSSFHSWKEVNVWAQKVFALKSEPKLENVFNEIFTGEESTNDKINKIVNYVQDEIRYMGIESGIGSIKPKAPEIVVKQRFGDCKDKSLLLVSLLKQIGIKQAFPVLVNTSMQHELNKLYPSNEVFNHCIVNFEYNDTSYWVDPTIAEQGGDFRELYIMDYGKVLIIGNESDTLQNMSPRKTNTSIDIVEELTVTSFTGPSVLKISSTQSGFNADQRRALLQYYSTKDLSDQLTKDLQLLYPEVVKTKDIEIIDNLDSNIVTMNHYYEVNDFWVDGDKGNNESGKGFWTFKYEPLWLYQNLNVSACEDRKYDFALNYPVSLNYKVIFHFPNDLLISDDNRTIENEAFYFKQKFEQLSSNSFQIDYTYRAKTNYIKADKYKEICNQKNAISKSLPVIIYFNK
ncbi:MAG: DUF3857 domain-containing protein [Salinivirgaceae bacterium]